MALVSHTIHNGNFEHRLLSWSEGKRRYRRMMVTGLMLTSMVDVFSMLVIFLLQTFSSSPEVLISKGVQLPLAISGKAADEALVLSLSQDEVFLDQKLLGKVKDIVANPLPLVKKLEGLRAQWLKTHGDEPFPGLINLQADQNIPSATIATLMGVVTGQNFDRIQLAVVSGGEGYEKH